ncbi:MAG TPA: methyltransferase domain-containing protein [Candidatus Binatia bacterium]|nr:methyltransferase domain-containing protein [Candidatus Binatia bacterium]
MGEKANHGCVVQGITLLDKEGRSGRAVRTGDPLTVCFHARIAEEIVFDPTFRLSVVRAEDGGMMYTRHMGEDGWDISWLPLGQYTVEWHTPQLSLPRGRYRAQVEAAVIPNGHYQSLFSVSAPTDLEVEGESPADPARLSAAWRLHGVEGLSWQKGKDSWFYKHFEHAARVVIYYMLDDSPLLRGRILDVGCGDGITDLGIFLRKRPQLFVGLDVEDNFRELSRMMRENGLPYDSWPESLIFRQVDANHIPYPDDYFDVVLSWGSLEHITGGYLQTLKEIKRVLKDGGLFFLHPGLYYSNFGHHIGEFSSEPFVHLKKSTEELKEIVFTAQPRYMDRGGLVYAPADFWRYHSELNKITVSKLERELRMLDFEFKKVAVRAEDLVTYTPELQKYSIQDLTTTEIYIAVVNHKAPVSGEAERAAERMMSTSPGGPFDYSHYEMLCKDRQWNRELLGEYIPYFANCRKVLDLACGSGIFLELLAEKGISAVGVERNKSVAEWGQAQGWEVMQQDVFEFLAQSQDTYDGIFCSHFLEHLPFDRVLQLIELILRRLEPAGTLVLVFPNPESIRMQLFGFWRDPEHVRFYHPELIETVCRHYGLTVIQTNREASPFAFPPPPWNTAFPEEKSGVQADGKRGLRETIRDVYREVVRKLRLVPRADLVALEHRLRQEKAAFQQTLAPWTEQATWAINRMWAWADNALIVCRKPEA